MIDTIINELEWIWKELVVYSFMELFWYLSGYTKKNPRKTLIG
jgi:hypothetical protein